MIKRFIFPMTFLFVIFSMICCNRHNQSSSNDMTLDDIEYVENFPQTFFLNNAVEVNLDSLDILGILDFCIHDSLLILTTRDKAGLWSFVSLPDYHFLGKFLKIGGGPHEFIQSPWVYSESFFKEKESFFVAIYDFERGKLHKMNITESLKENRLNIYTLNDSLPKTLFNFLMIDSVTFLCREINDERTKETRYILDDNNKKETLPVLEKLNRASVRIGEDFNILATITKRNADKKRIVEMPVYLNYINIYSLDGSFEKTVCIGKKLFDINEIQDKSRGDRIYTFSYLSLFPNFFGVVFINEDWETYERARKKYPSILLFDWKGQPLAEIKLNTFIKKFDIDLTNGYLYTFDSKTDLFSKYDIRQILEKL